MFSKFLSEFTKSQLKEQKGHEKSSELKVMETLTRTCQHLFKKKKEVSIIASSLYPYNNRPLISQAKKHSVCPNLKYA